MLHPRRNGLGGFPIFVPLLVLGSVRNGLLEFRSEPWQKPRMSSEAEGRFPRPSWRFEETALPPRMLHPRRNGLEEFPILVPLLVPGSAWRRRFRFAWGSLATGSFPKTFKSIVWGILVPTRITTQVLGSLRTIVADVVSTSDVLSPFAS